MIGADVYGPPNERQQNIATMPDTTTEVLRMAPVAPYIPKMLQVARAVLRDTPEYAAAVELGQGREWLEREANRLADRLLDEAWVWTPTLPGDDH